MKGKKIHHNMKWRYPNMLWVKSKVGKWINP